MSESLAIADAHGNAALVTLERLVVAVRSVARTAVQSHAVRAGLAAAESVPLGIVLNSDDAAATVVDSVRTIIDAEKSLTSALADIVKIPRSMEQAAREAVAVELTALKDAKERGNAARLAWQSELRRRAAALEAQQREQARRAAEAAAAEALEMGDMDEIPEAEIAPVVVPRTVSAGAAKSGTAVRMRCVEIVAFAECPPEWLKLDAPLALATFGVDVMQGKVKKPEPGQSLVYRGVRFEAVEHAVNR